LVGPHPRHKAGFQAARADLHRAAVDDLLARGMAYRDYTSQEDLALERDLARAEGRVVRSVWRDHVGNYDEAQPFVVRLRSPQDGETVVDDQVKGRISFQNKDLDDLILLRTDGTPTYNLAVVVDDHDMGVTHVIRGDDHLNNAARQTLIYQALGWDVPVWAHLPLIHGPDGAKLSKRHGAQAVGEFADLGYLPEAMRNYLARLGWGHGDDEIFSDAQAAAWFDVKDVVSAPARLDWAKLNHINNHYIRLAAVERLSEEVTKILAGRGTFLRPNDAEILHRTIPLVRDGAKTLLDLADNVTFALKTRPLYLPEKIQSLLTDETRGRLKRLSAVLNDLVPWEGPALEAGLRAFAVSEGIGLGKIGPALRGVLSGGSPAPDLAGAMVSLGQFESLRRIEDALSPSA